MRDIAKLLAQAPLSAKFGLAIIVVYIIAAVFAPILAPYPQRAIVGTQFEAISGAHWLGTDHLGRDMLSRLIYAARNTVGIAVAATALTFLFGCMLGFLAATIGGWVDQLLSRAADTILAIPTLIFALMLLTVFGTALPVLVLVIAFLESPKVFRIARSSAMNVVVMDFVEAARLRGEGVAWIMRREVLPNVMAPLVAEFGLRFCFVFLMISALSFLGLGIQPPLADWGAMVRETAQLISFGVPTPLIPAFAIALLTIAVNFVVDWFLYKQSGLKEDQA